MHWKIGSSISLLGYMTLHKPLFTRMTWYITSHGMYEITPDHQPLSSSLFQPYSSTSRAPSLHEPYGPFAVSYPILEDCPIYSWKLFCFSIFLVDPWLTSLVSSKGQSDFGFELWRELRVTEVELSTVMLRKVNSCSCGKRGQFPDESVGIKVSQIHYVTCQTY